MNQKIYQVDAFAEQVFSGNPAAVCPLDNWLKDDLLQKIAMENNLSETAFYVQQENEFTIRWFTPTVEVDLCGHATLAAAFVLFNYENYSEKIIHFHSPRSGVLSVARNESMLTLNFPTDQLEEVVISSEILNCFDIRASSVYKGKSDYLFVFNNEDEILNLKPSLNEISKLDARGAIVTAKGNSVDFVSRFFAPQAGVNEDPVTGSAHTTLTPYWAKQLNKTELTAIQVSERKGYLNCKLLNDRVEISGQARLYMIGEIFLSE